MTESPEKISSLYDRLAPVYHLYFEDFEQTVRQQGDYFNRLLKDQFGSRSLRVHDCSCGIGTQAIGIALGGHTVSASDLSNTSLEKAHEWAQKLEVKISLSAQDMCYLVLEEPVDAVISAGNSLSHLNEQSAVSAFQAIYNSLLPGGIFLGAVKDYNSLLADRPAFGDNEVFYRRNSRIVYVQHYEWEFQQPRYTCHDYTILQEDGQTETIYVSARFHCRGSEEYRKLLTDQGFTNFKWHTIESGNYHSPVFQVQRPVAG